MEHPSPTGIHLPRPSLLPVVMAFFLTLIMVGLILHWIISVVGVLGLLATLTGWMLENRSSHPEDEEAENG